MPRSNGSWLRDGDYGRCNLTILDKLLSGKHHHSGDGFGVQTNGNRANINSVLSAFRRDMPFVLRVYEAAPAKRR